MTKRRIFGVRFSETPEAFARSRQKSFVTRAFSSRARAALAFVLSVGTTAALGAAVCPTTLNPISTDQSGFTFSPDPHKTDIVSVSWMTMGRRSPTVYATTKYGIIGAYLGSNPAAPSPEVFQVSFRENGPVGGGSLVDCWPGPSAIAVADSSNGSGRLPMGWNDGSGCGTPEQVLQITVPGGDSLTYGQQIDVNSGTSVSATAVASAATSGNRYAAYFVDSSTLYVVDVTNLSFSAKSTPLTAIQTVSGFAGAGRLVTLGDSSSDHYLAGVFFAKGGGTVKFASIGSDGRLSVLGASATLSSGSASGGATQQVAAYSTGNGYLVFVVVSGGIDVFSFDGTTATRLGTIANGTNPFKMLQAPYGAPAPVLLAEMANPPSIAVIAGGFLAGQAGNPTVQTTLPALSNDLLSGFGAYIDPSSAGILYVYRIISNNGIVFQADTFDASCVTSPPTPNPSSSFTLVDKSAQNRTDKAAYVGDTFAFTDTSKAGTGGAITNWYVWANYSSSSSTKADADVSATTAPSLPGLVFPCQTLANGVCSYSPASITGGAIPQKFGELVSAGNLDSAVAINSISINVPLTRVAAQGSDGSVKILTGGVIDASASDGSPTGFSWSFKDGASNALTTSCATATCVPPASAATFTVAAKYAGGYAAAPVAGTVVFTDIAGSIGVPATLYTSQTTTTATFALQKGSSVTITGVSYKYDAGTATAISPVPALSSSVTINVPTTLTTGVNHTITFIVTYSGGSLGSSVSFKDTFLYSAIQYQPKAWLSKQQSLSATDTCFTNVFAGGATTCSGAAGTYNLGDAGDSGKPSFPATWDFGDGSPVDTSHTTAQFVSHTYNGSAGTSYTVKLTVAGTTVTQKFSISSITPPPSLSVSINGPTSVTSGAAGTWTAGVSGGSAPYTYNWSASDGGTGTSSSFTHTFSASGTVSLTVHDSAGTGKSTSKSVTVGGCTACGSGVQISGSTSLNAGANGSWTASVSGVSANDLAINWSIQSGTTSIATVNDRNPLSYAFASPGTYKLVASGLQRVGASWISLPASAPYTVTVLGNQHVPNAQFTVSGATFNQFVGSWSAKAGAAIQFQALETQDQPVFSWDFGDQTIGSGASVVHAFATGGNYTVKLTVTNSYSHTSSGQSKFAIDGQGFAALVIPGAGSYVLAGAGTYATELSLFNNSDSPVTIALDFETADAGSIDPTKLDFPSSETDPGYIVLAPNQGWSSNDVSGGVLGKEGLGTLFIKYTGAQPSALARIYFSSGAGTPTYGTYLPAYPITASGPSTLAAGSAESDVQSIVGLKFDDDYLGGIIVVSASPTGGVYDVSLFRDDGTQMGTTLHETIPGYQQIKLRASDFGITASDPDHVYYATVSPSAGYNSAAIAVGTVTDNRTRDSLLITDDTPVQSGAAGANATYYVAGAGRYANAKTDLYVLNTSSYPVVLNFSFHYIGDGGAHKEATSSVDPALRTLSPGGELTFTDVVTSLFPNVTDGLSLGELQVDYTVPADAARLVIEGRNYTDTGAGTYGMQLPAFAFQQGLLPGSSGSIVLTGLHNDLAQNGVDYDYISRFGFAALGDGAVTVHVEAYDQSDGSLFWQGDYALNSAGYGHFVYIPTTGANSPQEFWSHPAFNMVVTATVGDGTTPVAAFGTVQDTRSRDLVFIPGTRPGA